MQVLDVEEIKKEYSFLANDEGREIYFCSCGAVTIIEKNKETAIANPLSTEEINEILVSSPHERVNYLYPKEENDSINDEDEFADLFKSIRLSEEDAIICSGCQKNFVTLENQKKLIVDNSYFISGYNVLEKDDDLFLYYSKIKSDIKKESKDGNEKYVLDFEQKKKYIRFNITSKKMFFKDIDMDEVEFDLNKITKITDSIFFEEVPNIYNLYYVQLYVSKLAKYVMDVNNANVVEELLGEVRNRFNHAGLNSIKKVITIFLGIIKYSNLSTIALTKGGKFLYDLMKECDIPNSEKLEKEGLTSPIPIFNYLVSNYIKKINEEVNEDNKEIHEFLFKSSQLVKMEIDEKDSKQEVKTFKVVDTGEEKEMRIVYKENKNYKEGKITHNANANKFQVTEISNDANASKFIYKKIENFSDYKQLLKYFKFYDKHQIITLLQKYDLELLSDVIDLIYFRDYVDIKEFERIITIIKDFAMQETLIYKPTLNMESFKIDYSYVKKFDFVYYDDSVMMMEVLEFDPRREFNKIKTFKELRDYHDNLVKYFNVVSDKEKNAKFKEFVDRFKFLESREDYDGALEFKLISTPAMLITEGVQMKHSASSYSKKVITESYIIGQVFDRTPSLSEDELTRFTIGFTFDSVNGLEFNQVKGFANKPGTDRFKKLLMEFLTVKDISYRPIKDLKLQSE
jgi:hypothetical protein